MVTVQHETKKKSISVIACAFNEEDCIEELARRLRLLADTEVSYNFQFVLVDNGSSDSTWTKFHNVAANDSRFELVRLSRNFLTDGGLAAGLSLVSSDACVLMAADLQDSPEFIPEFIRKWEQGYENIYMVVQGRPDSSLARRTLSRIFYAIIDRMTNGLIPRNVSDFRLVDRRVYEAVRELPESSQFLRGLFAWVGFKSIGLPSVRPKRHDGESKASFRAVSRLARIGVVSFSDLPLRIITWIALAASTTTLGFFLVNLGLKVLVGAPRGFATITSLLLLGFSGMSLILAVIAQYVAVVLSESKRRPRFLIAERFVRHG